MAGQPNFPGWITFNVNGVNILETAGIAPASIVPASGPFSIEVTFDGSGFIWHWLETKAYQVIFTAVGFGVPNLIWPAVTGNLVAGQTHYVVNLNLPGGIAQAGMYQVFCLVTFPDCPELVGAPDAPTQLLIA